MLCMTLGFFQSCSTVPAGNVGIKFHLLGSQKGVDYDVLKPGRYWIGVNEQLYLFPTQNQTITWTRDDREGSENNDEFRFQSINGLKLSTDVAIEYYIKSENVPATFETYKKGADEISNKVLRNALRTAFQDASSVRTVEQMYGKGKMAFLRDVIAKAKTYSQRKGITLVDVYLLGDIRIPPTIEKAINNKIKATQDAQMRERELQATIATANKRIANAKGIASADSIIAVGKARNNRVISESLTDKLLKYREIEKWNGSKATHVLSDKAGVVLK